jgi:glycosyltransferase 2 family protein
LGLLAISWGKGHKADFISLIVRIEAYFARILHKSYNAVPTETSVSQIFSAIDMLGKGGWHRSVLGAIISTGFDMLTLYFFFIAAGYPVEPEILIVGYGLPLLLGKMAFLLPGGVGVVESSMAVSYTGLGVPGPITIIVILSYRIFSFWIPTLMGFIITFYLR